MKKQGMMFHCDLCGKEVFVPYSEESKDDNIIPPDWGTVILKRNYSKISSFEFNICSDCCDDVLPKILKIVDKIFDMDDSID